MGANGQINVVASAGGVAFSSSMSRSGNVTPGSSVTLPQAQAGSLTTRTNNTDGVITFAVAHGLTTANKIGVFWSGGKRYGCSITAVSTYTITIATGAGTNLPTQATAVIVGLEYDIASLNFDGDNLQLLFVGSDARCCVNFLDTGAASIGCIEVVNGGEMFSWVGGQGTTSPLPGNPITDVKAYGANVSNTSTLYIGAVLNP